MDSVNSIISGVRLDALTLKASEVFSSLQQSGLFRAIVMERSGQHVLLDTAFGKISGKASGNLQKGDEILARISSAKSDPTIKIEQHTPRMISLPKPVLNRLLSHNISLPAVARIVSQQANTSEIQISGQTIKLPKMDTFAPGQRVLLQSGSQQRLQVRNLAADTILKSALSSLLPRSLQNTPGYNLSTLQKLVFEIQNGKTEQLAKRISEFTGGIPKSMNTVNKETQPNGLATDRIAVQKSINAPIDSLKPLLDKLAAPLAKVQGIKPQAIAQILALLTLIKPTATQQAAGSLKSLPDTLLALMHQLKTSPESLDNLLRHFFQNHTSINKQPLTEQSLPQLTSQLRNELTAQTELTFNQLLTQKTSLGLQVEQNQPIQINLSIPVQVNDEVRNLKLSIRENNKQEQPDEQHWDIHLTFEFAKLGLISTHILLQDNQLSAQFLAQQQTTSDLINAHMHEFKEQLSNSGFELGSFKCRQGMIAEEHEPVPLPGAENLVDIKV